MGPGGEAPGTVNGGREKEGEMPRMESAGKRRDGGWGARMESARRYGTRGGERARKGGGGEERGRMGARMGW